jgi:hypothetical protein
LLGTRTIRAPRPARAAGPTSTSHHGPDRLHPFVVTGASSDIGLVLEEGFAAVRNRVEDTIAKLAPEPAAAQMHRRRSEPGSASQ